MDKRVEWTEKAVNSFRSIIFYYKEQDAKQAALKFQNAVFKTIEKLQKHPYIGRQSSKFKTVRKINVDAHRQLAYRVKGKTIFISNIWDSRRNPDVKPF